MQKEAYRVKDFCDTYSLSRANVYLMIATGHIRIRKCGRITFIARSEAERWFKSLASGTSKKQTIRRRHSFKAATRLKNKHSFSKCLKQIIRKRK